MLGYTESQFETTTIERLRALGYQYQPASTLDRDLKSVVLADRLRAHLARRYPHPSTGSGRRLPAKVLGEAVATARNPDGVIWKDPTISKQSYHPAHPVLTHRQDVRAGVVSAVKLVLCKRRIRGKQFQFILNRVMQQAEAGYEDWPMVA